MSMSILVLAGASDPLDGLEALLGGAQLVVVDRAEVPRISLEGAVVVHEPSPSHGVALKAGLAACRGRYVARLDPRARLPRERLARHAALLDAHPEVDAVTGVVVLAGHAADWEEGAPPRWWSAVTWRREALAPVATTAFFPVEAARWLALLDAGRVALVPEPAAELDAPASEAEVAAARHDLDIVRAHALPWEGAPALSVILATYDRRPLLLQCLESFCAQALPAGSYEIIVVEDGSPDDTAAWVALLELPVPFTYLRQANAGASAARNHGLRHARGRLSLWVNDDTIAAPDLIRTHLELHRRHDDPQYMVLGTFEQEPAALDNALTRYLEGSTEVFAYATFRAGERIEAEHFYTCNVSVPTEAIREVGGFDESYPRCGGEDTDMGVALGKRGYRLHYHPEARSWHRHSLDFDDLVRRQKWMSEATVRLFTHHPEIVLKWGKMPTITAESCDGILARFAAEQPALEAQAAGLAGLDVGALERAGLTQEATAVLERLGALLTSLNGLWWREGYAAGLRAHGLTGFPELLGRALHSAEGAADPVLSVVIPTHDRHAELGRLLDALEAQDLPPERFEVVVVDDGSPTPAVESVCTTGRPYALEVLRQANAGPGAARNAGVARSTGRFVLFLNDDAVPAPDLLRRHLEVQTTPRRRPVAVLGRFDLLPEHLDTPFRRLVARSSVLFAQPVMAQGQTYSGLAFCTGNLSVPRALLLALDGFDDAFRFAGAEDSELGYRLEKELGAGVHYDETLRCGHDHAVDLEGFARRQLVLGWCTWHMAEKHDDPSLIAGKGAARPDASFWAAVRDDVEARRPGVLEAMQHVEGGQVRDEDLEEAVRAVGRHAFSRGLLVAEAGQQPEDHHGGSPFAPEPWPLATEALLKLLLWPRYVAADLDHLFREVAPRLVGRDAALCLRFDPAVDGDPGAAVRALQLAYARNLDEGAEIEILLVDDALSAEALPRLGAAVDGVLPLPGADAARLAFLAATGAPTLALQPAAR